MHRQASKPEPVDALSQQAPRELTIPHLCPTCSAEVTCYCPNLDEALVVCSREQCLWPWDTAEGIEKYTLPIDDPRVLRYLGLKSTEPQANMSAHTAAALQLAAGSPTGSPALQPSRPDAPSGSPGLLALPPPDQLQPTTIDGLEGLDPGVMASLMPSRTASY